MESTEKPRLLIGDKQFNKLIDHVKKEYGLVLEEKKALIEGRLTKLIIEENYTSIDAYVDHLFKNGTDEDWEKVINRLVTNYTFFMREKRHFDFYKQILDSQVGPKGKELRLWCAGCSTGEEAYTLAMINADYKSSQGRHIDTKLLATDLSTRVLNVAKSGDRKSVV